jgi:ubiquinone/menaquinone biosynthesis C-methylase UbiE
MRLIVLVLLASALAMGQQHGAHKKGQQHGERTAEEWIRSLENPERDEWQQPARVVESLRLQPGQRVADIGAGSGYFSVLMARAAGESGKVFAVDIDRGLIDHLAKRGREEKLPQLIPVLADPDDPKLATGSVDLVFICNVIHHVENRSDYYIKLRRALKADGRLAIVDFYKRELPVGPRVEMKIAKEDMIAELRSAGFELKQEFDYLSYQYFLVFEPNR